MKMQGIRYCPLCGKKSRQARSVLGSLNTTTELSTLNLKQFSLVLCNTCGLIYISPIPGKKVFDELYTKRKQFSSNAYTGPRAAVAIEYYTDCFQKILREIDVISKNSDLRILEIGAGLSWMCRVAKNLNMESLTVAQDITSEVCEITTWVDHYVVGELESKLPDIKKFAPYQIISLTHVIEHLPDPLEALKICNKLLDKKGIIFITTPHRPKNWQNSSPIETWKGWTYNHVPAHLQYFNEKSIQKCANKAHLEVVFYEAISEEGQALEAWLKNGPVAFLR